VYAGFALSLVGMMGAVAVVVQKLTGGSYPGWASLVVVQLVLGGFIIVSTGVAGLYIGKIFEQVRERPLYVIDKRAARSIADEAPRRMDERVR
jgi:dolichol-phosphate mannosyltransferase